MMKAIIEISLGASLLIAVLLLCAPLLAKRYNTKWRYWVWLVVCLRLLVPVNFSLPSAPVTFTVSPERIAVQTPVMKAAQPIVSLPAMAVAPTQETEEAPAISLTLLLAALWLIGMALFFLWHLSAYILFLRSVKRYATEAEEEIQKVLEQVKERMGIDRHLPLFIHPKIESPMLFGFRHPTLLLPSADYAEGDLAIMLTHELIHFKRRDLWYKALLLVTSCVHWFNPLVHLMVQAAGRDIEASCDEQIVHGRDLDFRRQYGEMLLSAIRSGAAPKTALSTSFYGGAKGMKNRFIALFDQKSKQKGLILAGIILLASLTCGLIVVFNAKSQSDNIFFYKYSKQTQLVQHLLVLPNSVVYIDAPHDWYSIHEQKGYAIRYMVSSHDTGSKITYDSFITVLGGKAELSQTGKVPKFDKNVYGVYLKFCYANETIFKASFDMDSARPASDPIGTVIRETPASIGNKPDKNFELPHKGHLLPETAFTELSGKMTLAETKIDDTAYLQYTYAFPTEGGNLVFQFYTQKENDKNVRKLFSKMISQAHYGNYLTLAS